jgi:iron-sulfur cluster assembly accessory protein
MIFSKSASKEIRKIMVRDGLNPDDTFIRMGIKAGGCSGFTYTLDFDEPQRRKFDLEFQSNGLNVVVDKKSNLYIGKTTIDWSYDLMDRGLKFINPQAKGSCGCRTSFMIDLPQQNTQEKPAWMTTPQL